MHDADAGKKNAEGTTNVPNIVTVEIIAKPTFSVPLPRDPGVRLFFARILLFEEVKGEYPGDGDEEVKEEDRADIPIENLAPPTPHKMSGENLRRHNGSQGGDQRSADERLRHIFILPEGFVDEENNEEAIKEKDG